MKTQSELLQGTDIPTDDLVGVAFTADQEDFLAVVEGFAFNEWSKVSKVLGLAATICNVPENYDKALQREGLWTLDYVSPEEL